MKKILRHSIIIFLIAFLVSGTTWAFYSDNEISQGNELEAGKLDLLIDSDCHYTDCTPEDYTFIEGEKCPPPTCEEKICGDFGNFGMTDLSFHKFFNFPLLTIGDNGEDTISYHNSDNPAYGCLYLEGKEYECPATTLKTSNTTNTDELIFEMEDDEIIFRLTGEAIGHCAENAGYPAEDIRKIEWVDNDTSQTFYADEGRVIEVVFIKAGTLCIPFFEDTVTNCYTIEGLGTDTVTINENWTNEKEKCDCKDISHTEYVLGCYYLNYKLWFFGWWDDGDNIYEPQGNEVRMFGPIQAKDFIGQNPFTLADSIIGEMPANDIRYFGVSWCTGDMSVNHETGGISCEHDDECITTDEGFCLDYNFYLEQARHNYFTCEQ